MKKTNKKHKVLKVIGIILEILLALGIGTYFFVTTHTQVFVDIIRKGMYGDSSSNSWCTAAAGTEANRLLENWQNWNIRINDWHPLLFT